MPPPPAIGAVRSPKPAQAADGSEVAAEAEAPTSRAEPQDESATARWPALETELAEDDEPSEEVGSRSLPIARARPVVPAASAASSTSGLRVPTLDASSSTSGLRAPSLEPPAAGSAGDSAGSWLKTDGWDLDDASSEGGGASPAVDSAPDRASKLPKPSTTKEVGSVPSVPKLGASIPRPPATKEPGSVPPLPKLGGASPMGRRPSPLPKGSRAAEAASDAEERPLFGASSVLQGAGPRTSVEPPLEELASYASPSLDAAAIDASAPPSSASPLDALPSFDAAPSSDGASEDGVPAMDSMALFGAALAPVTAFEPAPAQATGLAPFGDADDAAEPSPSVPRLPLPGMMRDGPAPPAADFRAAPRTPRSQPAAAMPPPRGVLPPKLSEQEEARLKAGDTASFVAQVAVELMQEVERHKTEEAAATAGAVAEPSAEARPVQSAPAPAAASRVAPASAPPAKVVPIPIAPAAATAPTREAGTKRRGMLLGAVTIGVTAVIGIVCLMRGPDDEPTTQMAASSIEPAPTAPAAEGPPEGPGEALGATPSPPPEPDPAAGAGDPDPAAAADEADSVDPAEDGPVGEPEATTTATADAPVEATDEPETSSRKPSGKSRSGSKASGGGGGSTKEDPAPAPKADDSPTAEKLLKQARAAYNAGKGSSAYSLASKSNRMQPSGEAAEVMALAACQLGDVDKAKSALKTVTLFRRATVRSTCKSKHDVKLGL